MNEKKKAADILKELREERGLAPEEEEELKPAEELKKMGVSVKTTDQSYRLGDTARVEVSVKDTLGKAVIATPVEMLIFHSGNLFHAGGQTVTNENGIAYFCSELMPDDPVGTYTAEAVVTAPGCEPVKGSTTFEVVEPDAVAPVEKETEEPEPAPVPTPEKGTEKKAPILSQEEIDALMEVFAGKGNGEQEQPKAPAPTLEPTPAQTPEEKEQPESEKTEVEVPAVNVERMQESVIDLLNRMQAVEDAVKPERIVEEVRRVLDEDPEKFQGPAGKDGQPGKNGKDASSTMVQEAVVEEMLKNPGRFKGETGEDGRVAFPWFPGAVAVGAIVMCLLTVGLLISGLLTRPSVNMDEVRSTVVTTADAYFKSESGQAQLNTAADVAIAKKLTEPPPRPAERTETPAPTTEQGTETTEKTTPEPKKEIPSAAKGTTDFDSLMEMIK